MKHRWQETLDGIQERLKEPVMWFPLPALVAFGLILVLRGQVFADLNYRFGQSPDVIQLPSAKQEGHGIWLSIRKQGDKLTVTTDDKRQFALPLEPKRPEELELFVHYLRERGLKNSLKTGLSLRLEKESNRAVLAIDQGLNYIHVRPILFALAEAGIGRYGFETKPLR